MIRIWDVFICHASDDKDDFAGPLAQALRAAGVKVWFDEFEIKLGHNISQKIERGLANSEWGIIVLSQKSIQKNWPQYEASAIKQLFLADQMRLIPILKDISFTELRLLQPGLVDLKGIDANNVSISECAYRIIEAVRPDLRSAIHRRYVERKLNETSERYEIDPRLIAPGPRLREKLPERDVLRISVLHGCFGDLFDDGFDGWIDSFCRDLDYEREIRVWERMAACYLYCTGDQNYSKKQKKRIFGLLLGFFSGASDRDLKNGFSALGAKVGNRLYSVIEKWLREWQAALKYVVEHDISDDEEVQRLLDRHETSLLAK